jgi:hypothetical protein
VLCYHFDGKRADIPWSDAPYSWHLVPAAERTLPGVDPTVVLPGAI